MEYKNMEYKNPLIPIQVITCNNPNIKVLLTINAMGVSVLNLKLSFNYLNRYVMQRINNENISSLQ